MSDRTAEMSTKIPRKSREKQQVVIAEILSDKPHENQLVKGINWKTIPVARDAGVLPLLAYRVLAPGSASALLFDIQTFLQQATREHVALELNLRAELIAVSGWFSGAGIPMLLLKGAALAYTDYPAPFLRPRGDTDVLICPEDRPRAHELLVSAGYGARPVHASPRVSQQAQYVRRLPTGVEHTIDLHWRTFNPAEFADLLTFAEMWPARRPVPELGPASAPGAVHALLLSLLHRVAHHEPTPHLIWLFDVHLVARTLSAGDWDIFFDVCACHDVSGLCAEGLKVAADLFATHLPDEVEKWIAKQLSRPVAPRFRVFQAQGRRVVDMFTSDFRAAPTWRDRMHLVREHLLPPAAYMTARYGAHAFPLRPLLYLHRAATGARRWFRRDLFR